MQKIVIILICIILSTGCAVIRKVKDKNKELSDEKIYERSVIESVKKQNITRSSFFIEKAEITISAPSLNEKVIGSIKYEYPDKYLISIKSKTGIEAVRIFSSKDTILINDRINRKLYHGSNLELKNRYGITNSVLPLILGDFLTVSLSDYGKIICLNGKFSSDCLIDGIKIKYIVDCQKNKTILIDSENSFDERKIELSFSEIRRTGEVIYPGRIEYRDLQSMTTINIRIKKLELPWTGSIKFIPGNRYELMRIL